MAPAPHAQPLLALSAVAAVLCVWALAAASPHGLRLQVIEQRLRLPHLGTSNPTVAQQPTNLPAAADAAAMSANDARFLASTPQALSSGAPIQGTWALGLLSVTAAALTSIGWLAVRRTLGHQADCRAPLLMAAVSGEGRRVAVTGAGGRTGKLVVEKLMKAGITPVCIVKSDKAAGAAKGLGVPDDAIRRADVTGDVKALTEAFAGCEAVILCTSAVPSIKFLSLIPVFLNKLLRRPPARPAFTFPAGAEPEIVDWIGTRNQVDAAKAAGVRQFVMVSSMGGTQPENFLNTIGKRPDGTGGDILLWKRKGEKYLTESGLPYTIIHPGGLLEDAGGKRQLVFGVDDLLLAEKVRSIPRADVAELCVQALSLPGALNRSIDVISKPEGEGQPTTDFAAFFANTGNCRYEP
jgi:uncharacterized protein YbjT (DUF2867 family)